MVNISPMISTGLATPLMGYLSGLNMSTAGSSISFTIAPGVAADSTNVDYIILNTTLSKTVSAWAVGSTNGGLDTGSIAASTWYHVWLIKRPDTGVVDVLVSLSATAPTMPTNYTEKRLIGSLLTDGTSQWTKFTQFGDEFLWDVPVNNVNGTIPGVTTAISRTVTTPLNRQVIAILGIGGVSDATTSGRINISSLDTADVAASVNTYIGGLGPTGQQWWAVKNVRTNTSSQVRSRMETTGQGFYINTIGWMDSRGK